MKIFGTLCYLSSRQGHACPMAPNHPRVLPRCETHNFTVQAATARSRMRIGTIDVDGELVPPVEACTVPITAPELEEAGEPVLRV